MWGPHYLQPLALHLLEVLVVADLGHDAPDLIIIIVKLLGLPITITIT